MKVLKGFLFKGLVIVIVLIIVFFFFKKNTSGNFPLNPLSEIYEKTFNTANLFQNQIPNAQEKNITRIDEIQQSFMDETEKQLNESVENFDKIILETDSAIMAEINPLLKKIKIDKKKTDDIYLREMKNIISQPAKFISNLDDPKNLAAAGNYYKQKTLLLSAINPSERFQEFHQFFILTFGSKAYLFQKLSAESDANKKYALLSILDSVINSEDKLINNFIQQK